jgi:hypothetical protein
MKTIVRTWLLFLVGIASPLLAVAASAPRPPRGFASERFKPVEAIGQLPMPVWHGVEAYVRSEWVADAGISRQRPEGVCVWRTPQRVLAFGGLGADLDFVVYHHFSGRGDLPPDHDHLLVFKHRVGGEPSLAFSCVADELKPTIAAVRAAIAAGRCPGEPGPVETR